MKLRQLLFSFLVLCLVTVAEASTMDDSYRWLYAKGFNGMQSTGMTTDSDNNTYFFGFAYGDVEYDGHVTSIDYATDSKAITVIKVNASHDYQWTKKIHVQTNPQATFNVRLMTVDDDQNMYFGGNFDDSVMVNSHMYNVGDAYGYFLMKTDSAGSIQWFKAGETSEGYPLNIKYTAGRVAFQYGWGANSSPEVFGTELSTIYDNVETFDNCDMVVGALSATDGHLVFAKGLETNESFNLDQMFGMGIGLVHRNTLEADKHGNVYVSGGFSTNTLKVAGQSYMTTADMTSDKSQFVLRIDALGSISWVKLLTNASVRYPTLAVNDNVGVAALFPGYSDTVYMDDLQVIAPMGAESSDFVALFSLDNGDLLEHQILNAKTWHISAAPDGHFCVAGNIGDKGQNFGMDYLYNPDTLRDNLFVGFLDEDLNPIAGQSVLSSAYYMPYSITTGEDGKIRLIGAVNYSSDELHFGDYVASHSIGTKSNIYSVLDPKQLVKAQLEPYPMGCGLYDFFINPSIDSEYKWYVNDTLKSTEAMLSNLEWGGYQFNVGTNYVSLVLTDSSDFDNVLVLLDTISVYDPTITINTEVFAETGLVNYSVTIENFASEYRIDIDRGNYNYDTARQTSGSYIYEPGEQTISVILSIDDNWSCFYKADTTFIVPEPGTSSLDAAYALSDISLLSPIVTDFVELNNCPLGSRITVYNSLGKTISTVRSEDNSLRINSREWEPGFYVINVKNEASLGRTFKLIKP